MSNTEMGATIHMAHDHTRDQAPADANSRRLVIVLALVLVYMGAEIAQRFRIQHTTIQIDRDEVCEATAHPATP